MGSTSGAELLHLLAKKTKLDAANGFGGLVQLDVAQFREPVLVTAADGVGSKLEVAFATGRHDTIGIDAVAMLNVRAISVSDRPPSRCRRPKIGGTGRVREHHPLRYRPHRRGGEGRCVRCERAVRTCGRPLLTRSHARTARPGGVARR